MGRPPSNGAPSFRFHPSEVAQMDAILQTHEGHVPPRDFLVALAHRFSQSPERAGKIVVQMKQVWNWFQNRRYALRAKLVKSPGKPSASFVSRNEFTPLRYVQPGSQQMSTSSGPHILRNTSELPSMEFEARSARDGAWYDVQEFLSHRYIDTGNPEVLVCFAGFSPGEDEWVNIRKHVRQRSLPCETSECIVVLPGDLILCFQEGKEQALYFDARVLDAQRRAHDIRGCRCRFLVRFDHDQSEEIVPLRKICRRPETDYRLPLLHAPNEASTSVTVQPPIPVIDLTNSTPVELTTPNPSTASTVTVSSFPIVIPGPQAPITPSLGPSTPSLIGSPGPKSLPVPEQQNPVSLPKKVENHNPAHIPVSLPKKVENHIPDQIPDPVTHSNKIETDTRHLVPGIDKVASNSSGPVSVSNLPIKVENENSNPLPQLNNVKSICIGLSDGEAGTPVNFTGPIEASMLLKTAKAETVALIGRSASHVEPAKTQPK
ncbi:hypothetical protein KSS87_007906 [Heliosperma pusillum]|nr:hypothetical protein KSS87_007906 [Heliosperma pusillum]